MQLEWFTHSINECGEHTMHIRPFDSLEPQNIVVLNVAASSRMNLELNRAAMDLSCDFSKEKGRILAHYYHAFRNEAARTA